MPIRGHPLPPANTPPTIDPIYPAFKLRSGCPRTETVPNELRHGVDGGSVIIDGTLGLRWGYSNPLALGSDDLV